MGGRTYKMRDLEQERDKAIQGLSKAIGESTKPKTKDILSDLIALKTDDLVTQAGDPELGAVLFGEYMNSLYIDTWESLDGFIQSILRNKLLNLMMKNGIEKGSRKFARYLLKAGTEGSEKAGFPMRNENNDNEYDPG